MNNDVVPIELQLIRIMLHRLREETAEYRQVLKYVPDLERAACLILAERYDALITASQNIYDMLINEADVTRAEQDQRERCRAFKGRHGHGNG